MSTTIMALDMTTEHASIALASHANTPDIFYKQEVLGRTSSKTPVGWINDMLDTCHLKASDLKQVIVPRGPGSFTGVRLGLSVALGLELACSVQTTGVNLLDFLAYNALKTHPDKSFHILIPLLRQHFVAQIFDPQGRALQPTPFMMSPHDVETLQNRGGACFWDRCVSEAVAYGTPMQWDSRDLLKYAISYPYLNSTMTPLYVRPPSTSRPFVTPHIV